MPGTIDIAGILSKMDSVKYKSIIERAANNGYHDYKFAKVPGHPEYADTDCPKVQLVQDLSKYTELHDIKSQVMNGVYDETADEQDQEEMRGWLIEDNAPDVMFIQLGLNTPSQAERLLRKPINN